MSEQSQEINKVTPDFSHRINVNFYESMMYTLRRAEGLADMMEVAGEEDRRDALGPDTIRSVSHAIRMEMADAKAMLDAWNKGWR
ncbi:hypothetical protein ACH50O_01505 [Methylomonas sp. 2BW1-5-20]|uniref:hypothetical protein n=1 Tax=Methylomonas sp. 2BW1-5-20 TaxID=3376686 RepID=UPI004050A3E5